jgi:hypothetical protein
MKSEGAVEMKSAVERAGQKQVASDPVSIGEFSLAKLQRWASSPKL